MSKKEYQLAIDTSTAILNTLGEDDFFNVISFSNVPHATVTCFQDKLVRATPENVKEAKSALAAVECENTANFSSALETGTLENPNFHILSNIFLFFTFHSFRITEKGKEKLIFNPSSKPNLN
jgi:hypothetical protein